MTEPAPTVVSVRGDAQLEVAPDLAVLNCSVDVDATDKASALRAASEGLDAITSDLSQLGGVVRTAADQRLPLTWLAHSARSSVEYRWDKKEARVPTGRVLATVALRIEVRDFALMTPLGVALAGHEVLQLHGVDWQVDDGNAAWSAVRASAIEAAIQKGRDYAAALGGSLDRIEHLADIGLLAGGDPRHPARNFALSARAQESSSGGDGESPSLDPVPQTLYAAIEARFAATVRALG